MKIPIPGDGVLILWAKRAGRRWMEWEPNPDRVKVHNRPLRRLRHGRATRKSR